MRKYRYIIWSALGRESGIIEAKNADEAENAAREIAYKLTKYGEIYLQSVSVYNIKKNNAVTA